MQGIWQSNDNLQQLLWLRSMVLVYLMKTFSGSTFCFEDVCYRQEFNSQNTKSKQSLTKVTLERLRVVLVSEAQLKIYPIYPCSCGMEREDNHKELSKLQDYLWDEWNLLSPLFCTVWVVCDHEMSRKNGLMKPWFFSLGQLFMITLCLPLNFEFVPGSLFVISEKQT